MISSASGWSSTDILIATVPDPCDRQALGEAIDRYITAREREGQYPRP
jgi:hypothetical protein